MSHPHANIHHTRGTQMISNRLPYYVPRRRFHRIDGWRGYSIPATAIAGSSDTGMYSDSPCRSDDAKSEIRRFQREVLRPLGIKSRTRFGGSSNVFCGKRWVCVKPASFAVAAAAAARWFEENDRSLNLLHDADLDKCVEA